MTPSVPMSRHALAYAARGLRVFPVRRNRVPCILAWPTAASSDAVTVAAWWRTWPDANIRALTGEAFFVLDVDPRHGGDETLAAVEREHGRLPETLTCVTGRGGKHLYFATCGVAVATSQGTALGAGIDILGRGAAATLPPSVHENGVRYRWAQPRRAVAAPPAWLLERVAVRAPLRLPVPAERIAVSSAYARRAVEDEVARVASAPEGTRNRALNAATFSLATLAAAGLLDAADVERWMLGAAEACGLPHREAVATVRSGLRAGLARPRRVALQGAAR